VTEAQELRPASPPLTLSDEQGRLLRVWVTAASDGVTAFVSQRSPDDPAIFGRIVVLKRGTPKPLYSVYRPVNLDLWIVSSLVEMGEVGLFPSLHAALNFIRAVLPT
jgi:hypothetical protein